MAVEITEKKFRQREAAAMENPDVAMVIERADGFYDPETREAGWIVKTDTFRAKKLTDTEVNAAQGAFSLYLLQVALERFAKASSDENLSEKDRAAAKAEWDYLAASTTKTVVDFILSKQEGK